MVPHLVHNKGLMCECGLNAMMSPPEDLVREIIPPGYLKGETRELLSEFIRSLRIAGYEIVKKEVNNASPTSETEGSK
jgi:hypothetical protein